MISFNLEEYEEKERLQEKEDEVIKKEHACNCGADTIQEHQVKHAIADYFRKQEKKRINNYETKANS